MQRDEFSIEQLGIGAPTHGFRWMTFPLYQRHLAGLGMPGERVSVIAIGARVGVQPIGLLVAERPATGAARLVSVAVRPGHRQRGCARSMFLELESVLGSQDVPQLVAGGADAVLTTEIRALLGRVGFGPLTPAGQCIELESERLGPLVTRRDRWLPSGYSAVPWTSLTAQRRGALRATLTYPESLSPFRHEAQIEPTTSLALLANDQVVGWAIGHRINADIVHYATIFVREDLQNLGLGAGLFFTALARHCTSPKTRRARGRFLVRDESARMRRLLERRIHPYASRRAAYFEAAKDLTV